MAGEAETWAGRCTIRPIRWVAWHSQPVHSAVYGAVMADVTQIAFQIDNGSLAEIDSLVAARYRSRAEVVRIAVHDWLALRRAEQVDAALEKGYGVQPPGDEENSWAELSIEGLRVGELDW